MVPAPARDRRVDLPGAAGHDDRAPLHGERARSALPAGHEDLALDGRELLQRPVNIASNLLSMATIAPRRPAWSLPGTVAGSARLLAPLAVGGLVLLSVLLRTRDFDVGFWIDEGLSVGIADRPLVGHPGRAAAGRLAAALLHAPARLDLGLREHGDGHARALAAVRGARRARPPGGRRAGCSARRAGLARGAAGGHQPVPHPLRAGDADVRARGAAGRARLRRVRPRLRAHGHRRRAVARGAAALGGGVRGRAGRADVHAQLGAVLRRRLRADVARAAGRRARGGAARAAARRRDRLRRGGPAVRAVAADAGLPGPAHRRAVVDVAGAGATCWASRAGCWGRSPSSGCCWRPAPARWSCSTAPAAASARAGGRCWRWAACSWPRCWRPTPSVAGRPGVGGALPRGRAAAAAAGRSPAASRTPAGWGWSARCWSR